MAHSIKEGDVVRVHFVERNLGNSFDAIVNHVARSIGELWELQQIGYSDRIFILNPCCSNFIGMEKVPSKKTNKEEGVD
jgi:hypothetical protein